MRKSFIGSLVVVLIGVAAAGYVNLASADMQTQPGTPQQPVAQPGVPAQPVAQPGVPAQPVAQPGVPAQPVAQPVAQPGVPAQPVVQPSVPALPVIAPPTPTGDALVDRLNTKKFEVAPQMQPTSNLLKQVLAKGKSQGYQVQLYGPPYCQTFVATAGDAVKNIDLVLESPTGTKEAIDNMEGNAAAIANFCPTMPGTYKLTVSIPGDGGEFAVQVFSK